MKYKGHPILLCVLMCSWVSASLLLSQNMDASKPFPSLDNVFMEELTWMEVRDAIKSGKTTAIVATGGLEQNGPHVATGKHNYVLRGTTEAIARKLGNALVAPIVKFVPEGSIDPPSGHMRFAGTISLRQETFKLLLTDITHSLKQHGFTDIIFISESGGNVRGMGEVAEELNRKWAGGSTTVYYIPEYYEQDKWSYNFLKTIGVHQTPDVQSASRSGIHSDYHYEAMMAVVDPQTIRTRERVATGAYFINGFDMNPPSKTIENGKKLVEYRANLTVAMIQKAIEAK